jgi:hypothetical protein
VNFDGRVSAKARDVAFRPGEAGDKAESDRIAAGHEDHRCRRGCRLSCQHRRSIPDDRGHATADEIGHQHRQLILLIVRPAILDGEVLALDEPGLAQAIPERSNKVCGAGRRRAPKEPDHRHRRLLRARRERPCCRAAEQMNSRRFMCCLNPRIAAYHSGDRK